MKATEDWLLLFYRDKMEIREQKNSAGLFVFMRKVLLFLFFG